MKADNHFPQGSQSAKSAMFAKPDVQCTLPHSSACASRKFRTNHRPRRQKGAAVLLTSVVLSLGLLIMSVRSYKDTISNVQLAESAVKLEQAALFEQAAQNLVTSFDSAPESLSRLLAFDKVFNGSCPAYEEELADPAGFIDRLAPPMFKTTAGQAYEIEVHATLSPASNCSAFETVRGTLAGTLASVNSTLSAAIEDGSTLSRRKYRITSRLGCKESDEDTTVAATGGGATGDTGGSDAEASADADDDHESNGHGHAHAHGHSADGDAAGTKGSGKLVMTKSDKERNCITRTTYVWNDR